MIACIVLFTNTVLTIETRIVGKPLDKTFKPYEKLFKDVQLYGKMEVKVATTVWPVNWAQGFHQLNLTQKEAAMTPPTVFISYSHKDEEEKNALLDHLGVLQGTGLITVWSDDRISGGADWAREIRETMARAKVAILLISVNFLTSDFILNKEVPKLLRRRESEGLAVFPIIAKPCAWSKVTWLAKMNVRPKNGEPIWREGGKHADEELAAIAEEVADIIEQVKDDLKATMILNVLASEAQVALDACIERSRLQIYDTLPGDLHSLADTQLDTLSEAFLTDPPDLERIRSVLILSKNVPVMLKQIRALLQEPTLQRLVRRAGQQATQVYEQLAFGND